MITVPPPATTMSAMRPITGLQLSPEVVSEPPHSTPITSDDTGHGTRRARDAASDSCAALRVPSAMHATVPSGCRCTRSTGLPVVRMRRATSSVEDSSRPTSSTAAILGLRPSPASDSKAKSRSAPNCPRTNSVVTGMQPPTVRAMVRVTGLQLSITETTATQLRTPTAPFSRG
ncbi:hypothetical protein D9M68_733850 [compost metagenome]